MAGKSGPGKAYRTGITLMDAVRRFDTEEKAEAWFIAQRWPDGITCPHCESDRIANIATRKPQPWRCKSCRKHFSIKTGTLMHSSNIPLSKWAIAFYLFSTSLKGVSSMKLRRDLGIGQEAAWYMGHRIRGMWGKAEDKFAGPVEADETDIGGSEKNKHESKNLKAGRGAVGKTPVAGIKDRGTNQVRTEVVERTNKTTLQEFVIRNTEDDAMVYTDEHAAYKGIPRPHEAVAHGAGEYHHISVRHLPRYSNEFEGRHNSRPVDSEQQMGIMARGSAGKRMTFAELTNSANTGEPRTL